MTHSTTFSLKFHRFLFLIFYFGIGLPLIFALIILLIILILVMKIVVTWISMKHYALLDMLIDGDSDDVLKNVNRMINVSIDGMRCSHFLCISWNVFKEALNLWHRNVRFWFIFAKFCSIYQKDCETERTDSKDVQRAYFPLSLGSENRTWVLVWISDSEISGTWRSKEMLARWTQLWLFACSNLPLNHSMNKNEISSNRDMNHSSSMDLNETEDDNLIEENISDNFHGTIMSLKILLFIMSSNFIENLVGHLKYLEAIALLNLKDA